MKFIHLTDLHLVTPGDRLKGLDPVARLEPAFADIARFHADAECCVITGDLADIGDASAYAWLAERLARFELPCHLLIGNHDNRGSFLEHFANAVTDAQGFVQSVIDTSAGKFVLLDTIEPGTHGGVFCAARQVWLRQTLDRLDGEPVYLFMHHPPFDLHLPCIDRIGLAEQQAVADIVAGRGNVRHLFFGHAHRPISGNWKGISFSSLRGTNHQVGLQFEREQIDYVDESPEYAVVFIDDDQIVVHNHSYPCPAG